MTSSTDEATVSVETFECRNLEQLLCKHFGEDFALVEYKTERLVPMGENFGSIVMKIDVKARRTRDSPTIEDFHFVGKTMAPGSTFTEKIDFGDVFNKEAFMYTNIIPFYVKVERDCGFSKKESIAHAVPLMYGHRLSLDPNATKADKDVLMLLENLKVQDYYVVDKTKGLDLEHAMVAIKALAHFHAVGIAARRRRPAEFEAIRSEIDRCLFDSDVMDSLYDRFIEYMRREPRLAVYYDRVQPIMTRLRGSTRFEERTHDLWATLLHHDCWTNNILFHRDDVGRPDSFKFIDFQAYAYADVYVDLSYFLCTSLNDEVTDKHFDELLDVYYNIFVCVLKRLDVDVAGYSKEAFDERYRLVGGYDLPRNIVAMIFFTAEIDSVKDAKDVLTAVYNFKGNERLVQKVLKIIKIFEERDWLH